MNETPQTRTPFTWMHRDHYHCGRCMCRVTFVAALPWRLTFFRGEVRRVGMCPRCLMVLVEHESGRLTWLPVVRWFVRQIEGTR